MSIASPSGSFLPSSISVVRPVPSGLTDSTRPAERSRKNSRPTGARGLCGPVCDPELLLLIRRPLLCPRNNGYGWSLILGGSDPGRPHAPERRQSCLANGELIRHILPDSAFPGR